MKRALCWLRRDLRLSDHSALAAATREADEVALVFVFDTVILNALADKNDRRVTFIHESLVELDERLRQKNSRLICLYGDPTIEIPKLAREWRAEAVFAASDYESYAIARDTKVARELELRLVKDHVVLEASEVLSQTGSAFRVFTPFYRQWRANLDPPVHAAGRSPNLERLASLESLNGIGSPWAPSDIGFEPGKPWLEAGEIAGLARLRTFRYKIARYDERRDFPAEDSTSGLSVHLRFGTISVRAALRTALDARDGGEKWLSELAWREFYSAILQSFPGVETSAFQPQYGGLEWPGSPAHLEAWQDGRTGYPIVDAAIRCLNETGWMHNRLRMIVASFLTKDLLVDYREGEAYFARKLLDFDLASNNGGWQWAASVGADAQPYFRIFNPILQSKKFDPDGAFLRRWLPELAPLDEKWIHAPWQCPPLELAAHGIHLGETYPAPIVDHDTQRKLALSLLSSVAKGV